MKSLTYYFDFLSPFSYLSWQRSRLIRENPEIQMDFRPVMMTSLFSHFQIKAPGEVAPKREFMLKQCFRIAHREDIALNPPEVHPFNPLYALRIATKACAEQRQEQVIDALWEIGWVQGLDLGNPEVITAELNKRDLPGEILLEKSFSREAKIELKTNINTAKEEQAFGVPTWIYQNELFWGNDALMDLHNAIMGKDQWDRETYRKALASNPLKSMSGNS